MTVGIYQIMHIATGRRYIGQSLDIEKRIGQHRFHLEKGDHHARHLQSAWLKYGREDFDFEIIEACAADILDQREQYHLDQRAEFNARKVASSNRGVRYSDESKRRMSLAMMGKKHSPEARKKMSAAAKGKVLSSETRAKMSVVRKGIKQSESHVANRSKAQIGRKHSASTIEKMNAGRAAVRARKAIENV